MRWETTVLSALTLTVMLQFMPDMGEAFYWFNGGVGNVFIYSLMALSAALLMRLYRTESRGGAAGLTAGSASVHGRLGRRKLQRRTVQPVRAGVRAWRGCLRSAVPGAGGSFCALRCWRRASSTA